VVTTQAHVLARRLQVPGDIGGVYMHGADARYLKLSTSIKFTCRLEVPGSIVGAYVHGAVARTPAGNPPYV